MTAVGLRKTSGRGGAAPPYTDGPYTWDQNVTFSGTVTMSTLTVTGTLTFGDAAVDVLTVTGYQTITLTAPTAQANSLYAILTASSNWTGSVTGVRSTVTSSATGACGNAYGGRFELSLTANPSTSGHTTGLYVQLTTAVSASNPTSVLSIVKSGAAGGATTPYIFIQDSSTTKSTLLMDIGGVIGGGAVGTTSGQIYYNGTLRLKVNSDTRYIPLSTTEGIYTTAYGMTSTGVGISSTLTDPVGATTANAFTATVTESGTWSSSVACIRASLTSTANAVSIGNARALMSKIVMTNQPSSQGHTTAGYFEATATQAATNLTSVLSLTIAQGSGGASTPFIFFDNTSSVKTNTLFTLGGGAGGNVGSGTAGELHRSNVSIGNVNELTQGFRVMVNNVAMYLIGILATDV